VPVQILAAAPSGRLPAWFSAEMAPPGLYTPDGA